MNCQKFLNDIILSILNSRQINYLNPMLIVNKNLISCYLDRLSHKHISVLKRF